MNVLFKNRYFRRECVCRTWTLKRLSKHIDEQVWYFDYDYNYDDNDYNHDYNHYGFILDKKNIILKLCETGNLRYLKRIKKNVYDTTTVICSEYVKKRLVYRYNEYCCGRRFKTIDFGLIISSLNGHLAVVRYLVEKGADIHAGRDEALLWSAEKGHLAVVQYLVEQGGDIHAKGADIHAQSDYALRYSAQNGHFHIVQYLIEQGGDIHIKNNCVLQFIACYGHLEWIQYLVEHGADIHANNDYALHNAINHRHLSIVLYLLEKGCSMNHVNITNDSIKFILETLLRKAFL